MSNSAISGIANNGATTPADNAVASGQVGVPTAGSIDDVSSIAAAPSVPDMSMDMSLDSTASLEGARLGKQVRSSNLAVQQILTTVKGSVPNEYRLYANMIMACGLNAGKQYVIVRRGLNRKVFAVQPRSAHSPPSGKAQAALQVTWVSLNT